MDVDTLDTCPCAVMCTPDELEKLWGSAVRESAVPSLVNECASSV